MRREVPGAAARRKLIIVGDSAFAEIADEYFTADSRYDVVGFSVERAFLSRNDFRGRPIVPFEELPERFSPADHDVFVAIVYTRLNRLRTRLLHSARLKGYKPASYISRDAWIWSNVQIGEHCFIFERCTIQPFSSVGENTIIWSCNHVGHHSRVGNNVFIAGHVAIAGFCEIGDNTFLGGNSIIANNLRVGSDCWVGPGAVVSVDLKDRSILRAAKSQVSKVSTPQFFKLRE